MISRKNDVIIIGSGVGGLVCANYLAATGLKVLVIEKNREAGGYCTSFTKNNLRIDTTIHAIQDCSPGNVLYKIFSDLQILHDLNLFRRDPTDTIIIKGLGVIHIYNDYNESLRQFIKLFPKEKEGLRKFFNFIYNLKFIEFYYHNKAKTFKELMNEFFKSEHIKAVFEIFLGNIGSFAKETSAITAVSLLRQFIFSGGYYPLGGIQKIPDLLVKRLLENNGEILLKNEVVRIEVNRRKVKGVELKNGDFIPADLIVSNSDFMHTFTKLINLKNFHNFYQKIMNMSPAYSIYIVYLILNTSLKNKINSGPGVWFVPNAKCINYERGNELQIKKRGFFMSITSKLDQDIHKKDQDIVRIMTTSKFHDSSFWRKYSMHFSEELINGASSIFPDFRKYIICEGRATSLTMQKYTFNYNGSVSGWKNTIANISDPINTYFPNIEGLYLTGHWDTQKYGNGGVAMAAYSGQKIAKKILKEKFKPNFSK